MSQWAEIRHLHLVERVPKKEIARRLKLDVKTVRRAISRSTPPVRVSPPRPGTLDPWRERIRQWLREEPRLTAKRIRRLLLPMAGPLPARTVRRYVAGLRTATTRKEAFVHRSVLPGTTMEVDFGESWVDIAGGAVQGQVPGGDAAVLQRVLGVIARFVRRITLRARRPSVSTSPLRFCDSVSRCPANAELFCGSSGGQSSLDEFLRGGNCVRVEWRSTRCAPAFPGRGDAVAGPLGDEPAFEVRDGAEDVEHEFAGRGRGVEALLEAEQVDAAGLEVVDGFEQLPE